VENHIPEDFLFDDIIAGKNRHIVFATPAQQYQLERAKRWYIDATFKVVKPPFTQLLSIHVHMCFGDDRKQLPLAYALMSGKSASDYEAVFRAINNRLDVAVEESLMDFERAMWVGLRAVFPNIKINGCAFHWMQAIYRNNQAKGLQTAYSNNEGTHDYLRRLMALPYLPAERITGQFNRLAKEANNEKLKDLVAYMRATWIEGGIWSPQDWSVFMLQIRTNNDTEGWHNRLNHHAGRPKLPFYLHVEALHKESLYVQIQKKLMQTASLATYKKSAK
jgi:hypothetical protein